MQHLLLSDLFRISLFPNSLFPDLLFILFKNHIHGKSATAPIRQRIPLKRKGSQMIHSYTLGNKCCSPYKCCQQQHAPIFQFHSTFHLYYKYIYNFLLPTSYHTIVYNTTYFEHFQIIYFFSDKSDLTFSVTSPDTKNIKK